MLPNGKRAEQSLVKGLQEAGFHLVRSKTLDEDYKVDFVVTAPPTTSKSGTFFPPPIAAQVTLSRGDWSKRGSFLDASHGVAARRVYIELETASVNGLVVDATCAALIELFQNENAPADALAFIGQNRYRLFDLRNELGRYRDWMRKPITGELHGVIRRWGRDGQYGFILVDEALDGLDERPDFFFHIKNVADEQLAVSLAGVDGELDSPIPVTFEDGGHPRDEHWNKNAVRVRRPNTAGM